jgi:lambda repressor-like predicted transcriptional regulator
METVRLEEAVQRHGFRRTCREAGVSLTTLEAAIKGMRLPKEETAEKIADALGVGVDEIQWPLGYGERLPGGVLRLHGQIDEMPRVTLQGPVQVGES